MPELNDVIDLCKASVAQLAEMIEVTELEHGEIERASKRYICLQIERLFDSLTS